MDDNKSKKLAELEALKGLYEAISETYTWALEMTPTPGHEARARDELDQIHEELARIDLEIESMRNE